METFDTPGELVRRYEKRTKKQFGQHFLVDPNILHGIAAAADVGEGDRVFEVGPGCGTLTLTMLQRGAKVLAVELDRDLAAFLRENLAPGRDLELVEGDILDQDVGELLSHFDEDEKGVWKCAANLPYNVATEVFFRLADVMDRFACLALMFQREVAERFVARAGDDDYGVLSLMSRLYADSEIVMTLPPGAFRPPPRVHSAVVRFEPVPGTRIPDDGLRDNFKRVVRAAFQTRRKTLPNALKSTGVPKPRLKEAISAVGLDLRIRPERVSFEAFEALARELHSDLTT
ncbi:16S rRNA (adenine(1518)-N(6)/adenine(1519)-N(6))-dimethyltransferase RsmA [Persicimonas caeni]|uniref:16S rRNA (adenine(1518)-N(6)/adenine(1519)-N(6))- dimethyltransferase RsmA n=1 Tax=Persicimonas caeni TaxID=2292766 RepID=UPI00143DD7A7|nr:16S rRNA (adenine(1518)-N(6)/adenine(1519)-N(6))-dimethyltransferase RsmA [Persicimonas caeni]